MNEIPSNLQYSKSHEWVRDEGDGSATVGITHHAQQLLGDLVFVELPELGKRLELESEAGVVESVKAASDLYSPLAGEVIAVNEALADAPEQVNESPYEDGWVFRVRLAEGGTLDHLMDAEGYAAYLEEEEA